MSRPGSAPLSYFQQIIVRADYSREQLAGKPPNCLAEDFKSPWALFLSVWFSALSATVSEMTADGAERHLQTVALT